MNQIDQAVAQFRTLLEEQQARVQQLENAEPAVDYTKKETVVIGIAPGDGIGPIITEQTRRVLEKLLAQPIAEGRIELRDITGLTIENRMELGVAVPPDTLKQIKACDVLPHRHPQRR